MDLSEALTLWTTYKPEFRDNPYPVFDILREHGPVHQVPLRLGDPAWVIVRYDEALAALTDPRLGSDPGDRRVEDPLAAAGLGWHLAAADPPDHTRMRNLIAPAFNRRRIEALRPRVNDITEALLDLVETEEQVDLLETVAVPLAVTVICELLGVPPQDRATFREWVKNLTAPAGDPITVISAATSLREYLLDLIKARQAQPGDDLLSTLTDAHRHGTITDAEMISNAFLILVAGHETTVNLIGNGTVMLLKQGKWQELGTNLDRLPHIIEELLRIDGPLEHATVRWAREDLSLGGQLIPAGARVLVILDAANRDPKQFPDPGKLDFHRRNMGHLSFGHGIHYCVGAQLARMEGEIAFRALYRRFPNMELAVSAEFLHARPSLLLRSWHTVPVQLNSP